MSIFEGPSETTTSIGRRCRGGDAYSRAILIARTLSQSRPPPRKGGADGRTRHKAGEPPQRRQGMHPHPPAPVPAISSSERESALLHTRSAPGRQRAGFPHAPLPSAAAPQAQPETPQRRAGGRRRTHKELKAATAGGLHLFPFRTEKLNPRAPMILRKRESRSPPPPRAPESNTLPGALFSYP